MDQPNRCPLNFKRLNAYCKQCVWPDGGAREMPVGHCTFVTLIHLFIYRKRQENVFLFQ